MPPTSSTTANAMAAPQRQPAQPPLPFGKSRCSAFRRPAAEPAAKSAVFAAYSGEATPIGSRFVLP